ncbi:transporter substrate-binding domain-containing protein [Pantoea sp. B65]|uniref:transporter substrate-binding domain-containing protein n=1 Tax=Pantoea sp. B65 TaxID=2813359 RepID=UPI0039B575BF
MPSVKELGLAQANRLSVAINLGNPVLATTEADGQPGGITVALARKIAAALEVELTLFPYSTAGKVVDDAAEKRWDLAFLAIDPKRAEVLSFTEPYMTIEGTLMVKAASEWQSVGQMDKPGVVINVGKGAAYDLYLSRTLTQATLHRLPSSQHAIAAFVAGEGDMAAGVRQPLELVARQNPDFRVLRDSFTRINQAICVPVEKTALYAAVCSLLAQWQQDGSVAAIIAANTPQD